MQYVSQHSQCVLMSSTESKQKPLFTRKKKQKPFKQGVLAAYREPFPVALPCCNKVSKKTKPWHQT